jgi:hypothetical protein
MIETQQRAFKFSFTSGWGWLFLFCVAIVGGYGQISKDKKRAIDEYAFRFQELEKARCLMAMEREELQQAIASQDDPAWIEMVLMRDLGVVPDGWLKIYFP